MKKVGADDYTATISGLEFCLGSYNYDKNPVGLYEYGAKALADLKAIRDKKPRQVAQKLLDGLEKAIAEK